MILFVGEKFHLVCLILTMHLLDLLLSGIEGFTDASVLVKDLVVKELREFYGSFIHECRLLINTNYIWYSCLKKYFTSFLRVARCYIYEL